MPFFDRSKFGLIRIIKTPDGELPIEVREAWVNVTLPCVFFDPCDSHSRGIISGKVKPPRRAYLVLQKDAVEALSIVSLQAALHLNHLGYPKSHTSMFSFTEECVFVEKRVLTKKEMFPDYEES